MLYLHLMGTDYKKIAELLDKSPKSIDNALQRIRNKAERMLGEDRAGKKMPERRMKKTDKKDG